MPAPLEEYVAQLETQTRDPRVVERLTEDHLWSNHQTLLWRTRSFEGSPSFYPVYRSGDLYSHTPLALALAKGRIRLVARRAHRAASLRFRFLSNHGSVDADVERLGGPLQSDGSITQPGDLVDAICAAMRSDIAKAERDNPGCRNLVLCGGKDSLNLLLLPWRRPPLVASAAPNFALVRGPSRLLWK